MIISEAVRRYKNLAGSRWFVADDLPDEWVVRISEHGVHLIGVRGRTIFESDRALNGDPPEQLIGICSAGTVLDCFPAEGFA